MVIVVGGTKGGTGKSTIAFHIAVNAFLLEKPIITYDYDFPQFSFTRYYNNRKKSKINIWKEHYSISDINHIPEFKKDCINIIDTPGRYDKNILNIHKNADIIITPVNDSLMDIDTIMQVEQERWGLPGNYYEAILENKKHNSQAMWLIVRNRSSATHSKYKVLIEKKLDELAKRLNCSIMQGLKERNIFRELFADGTTVFDIVASKMTVSQLAAKMEIKLLWKKIEDYIKNK